MKSLILLMLLQPCLQAAPAKRPKSREQRRKDFVKTLVPPGSDLGSYDERAESLGSTATESDKSLAETEAAIEPVKARIEAAMAQLGRLRQEYAAPKDLSALAVERARLRSALEKDAAEFTPLQSRYSDLFMAMGMAKLTAGFASFMSKGTLPVDATKEIADGQRKQDYNIGLRDFSKELKAFLEAEQEDFAGKVEPALQRRRRTMQALAGLGALAAASLVLFLLKRSRRSRGTVEAVITQSAAPEPPVGARALPAAAPIGIGSMLCDTYRIERELGHGGMGVVYEATDVHLQRKVAIKRMHDSLSREGRDLEMFMSEARLVASLKHPNIVEIFAIIREAGQVFLVFEFVPGHPLSSYIASPPPLSLRQVKSVVRQVAAALDYAHTNKVIHRDLKPANVMVTQDGVAKVMDFGIAHRASVTAAKLTRAQSWGTPPYMAPEQELGSVSRESDVFALGVMFYELLTGNLPFQGPNFLAQKQQNLYVPASKALPGVPVALDGLLGKVLQPDPKNRFHSAKEFSGALSGLPDA